MTRSPASRHVLPLGVLLLFVLLDLAVGRSQVVLGLVTLGPLVAATTLDRRGTAAHAVLALGVAALLGVWDRQYTAEAIGAQAVRLFGVALAGVVAVVACSLRLRHEAESARLGEEAATTRAALRTAETLQRHLLGDPPSVPPLESAARYVPAGRHSSVGGDWYDAFPGPDGAVTLVIGDVAGHDAPAAAVMAQVRGMVRALARTLPPSPAAVLRALDEVLVGVHVPTLVTVVVATVDLHAGREPRLRWSNAGHPPPVLARAGGGTTLLERAPEPLLGLAPGLPRTDHELPLRPGDTLVLYTDGLVERRTAPLDEGLAWLVAEVDRARGAPPDRLCDGLLSAIGGRVDDDVALLAVRVPPEETPDPGTSAGRADQLPGAPPAPSVGRVEDPHGRTHAVPAATPRVPELPTAVPPSR